MRLDKYLKITRLIKRRTIAKKACGDGNVFVNGKEAKASMKIKINDIIEIKFGEKEVKAKVIGIESHIKKEDVDRLIEYL